MFQLKCLLQGVKDIVVGQRLLKKSNNFHTMPFTCEKAFVTLSFSLVLNYYRPQTKLAKVVFLHLSVRHSVHRGVCLSACWEHAGIPPDQETHPPRSIHPPDQAPPLGADPPGNRHPPLGPGTPPLHSACWEIRSTSGRYASCRNAILLGHLASLLF